MGFQWGLLANFMQYLETISSDITFKNVGHIHFCMFSLYLQIIFN